MNVLSNIDKNLISMMKDWGSLVNTAIGVVIKDIDVFYKSLKKNKLSNVLLFIIPHESSKNSLLVNTWKKEIEWIGERFIINLHTSYYNDKVYFLMRNQVAKNAKKK